MSARARTHAHTCMYVMYVRMYTQTRAGGFEQIFMQGERGDYCSEKRLIHLKRTDSYRPQHTCILRQPEAV